MNWDKWPSFLREEFDSKDLPGSGDLMDPGFMYHLQQARTKAQIPFVIVSGYRTKAHNQKVGGVPDSAHTHGLAADISTKTSHERLVILKALIETGFDRIGIANSFIHVDIDNNKAPMVAWLY